MEKKENLRELFREAEEFIQLFSKLDYAAILAHEPAAVAELQDVVRTIGGAVPSDESLEDYAAKAAAPIPGASDDDKVSLAERRRSFVEALGNAGLGGRLGKVYCTATDTRQTPFRDVPHKQGLPQFDMVVAADFSPQSGYHGIFIGAQEVMSWALPAPYEGSWQLRERHRFASLDQMVELTGLLSAGFPVG